MSINPDALLVLLQASSKKAADVFLGVAFLDVSKRCPQRKLDAARAILPIEPVEFNAAFESAKALIAETLRRGAHASVVEDLLGADFHPQLRELLSKVILANAPVWTEALVQDQVSLPRLIDVNWRVDVVASSSSMSRQARPTVICEVRLQDPSPKVGGVTGIKSVQMELNKQTIQTMVDGLVNIKQQLDRCRQTKDRALSISTPDATKRINSEKNRPNACQYDGQLTLANEDQALRPPAIEKTLRRGCKCSSK